MSTALYLLIALVVAGGVYLLGRTVLRTLWKFRGTMVVTCPETQSSAAVEVDARHAALTGVLGEADVRLRECTRWPQRQDCGQECLKQIEVAPENCLVRTMLAEWYSGKSCVFCGKGFGEINWFDHKPALITPEGKTVAWSEVAAETLAASLSVHKPVCWNCHIAQRFRHTHPEMVVDGPTKRD